MDSAAGRSWEITGYVHNVVFTCGAVAGARWNGEDLLGRRRHGHVRGRGEYRRSGRSMPGSQQTGKVSTVLSDGRASSVSEGDIH